MTMVSWERWRRAKEKRPWTSPGRRLMAMLRRSTAEAAREAAAVTALLLLLCYGFGMVMKTWRF